MHRHLACALVFLLACGDDDETPEPQEASEAPSSGGGREGDPPEPSDDPLAGLDDPEAIEDPPDLPAPPEDAPEPPPMGCAAFGDLRIWPRDGVPEVVAFGDGFAFAGYARSEADAGELFVVVVDRVGESPRPVLHELLERPLPQPRVSPPGLAAFDRGHLGLAITDLGARVLFDVLHIDGERLGFREVGSGADQRFAPAVTAAGDTRVVAYTDGSGEGTAARLVRIDPSGRVIGRHDLTPEGSSGRATTVVAHDEPAVLFVDAREATSTAFVATLNGVGVPSAAEVIRPLANLYDPVELSGASVATPDGPRWLIGYTAIGSGAASAVGVAIGGTTGLIPPTPLVPSEGYGTLGVDGAATERQVVFAAEAPRGRERTSPREIRVRIARGAELGESLVVRGPDESARHASIARGLDGTYALAFASGGGVYVRYLRCDEP